MYISEAYIISLLEGPWWENQYPHKILGLPKNSSDKVVSEKYKDLSKKYHPDLNKHDPKAAEKMKAISWAKKNFNPTFSVKLKIMIKKFEEGAARKYGFQSWDDMVRANSKGFYDARSYYRSGNRPSKTYTWKEYIDKKYPVVVKKSINIGRIKKITSLIALAGGVTGLAIWKEVHNNKRKQKEIEKDKKKIAIYKNRNSHG